MALSLGTPCDALLQHPSIRKPFIPKKPEETTLLAPNQPRGYYGTFGGAYVPEILVATFQELETAFAAAQADPSFWREYETIMGEYSCRPTPLTFAENLTRHFGGARIFVKREDLNHTGAHKANNVMGQGLLVRRMGKKRVIAETGAGQHGVATATMAAKFGFDCTIYMGEVDVERQRPNVFWMERLGAQVVSVKDGSRTLKDAINEAFRDWAANMDTTHYVLGTACGPHPFPTMVSYFQSIIGKELREQVVQRTGRLPRRIYACVGGGSNALGVFGAFLDDAAVELVGVEAGGRGIATHQHAARLASPDASVGVAQGYRTYFLQNEDGQMMDTHSVAAGLDYIGVSPILAYLRDTGRVRFEAASDQEVVAALALTVRREGLIPALESSHAFVQAFKEAPSLGSDEVIVINQSGRGDKDIFTVADAFDDPAWRDFIRRKAEGYAR
jgi:tryptophan synthase beta chain